MRGTAELVERGRGSFAASAWRDAHEALTEADRASRLDAHDLERLAVCAYMLGRDDEYVATLERAQQVHLDAGEIPPAVRCAFWIGINLLLRGARAPASGWFGRARRLLERGPDDCVERGYLLLPVLFERNAAGDLSGVHATAAEAMEIGTRFGDPDLVAIFRQEEGHALVREGRLHEGLRLIDEVMVAVAAGELSPVVTGLVYCNTIAFCRDAYELRRAREWTAEMTRWCGDQPDMVAHKGICQVHRAELLELGGSWDDALEEAVRAGRRLASDPVASGYAQYRQGEVHRLRGELAAAEDAYREASRRGHEPQPGLALLRLAQGNGPAAAAALERVLGETPEPLSRAGLLPARVEVALAMEDLERAREASDELDAIAARQGTEVLDAIASRTRGAVRLAEGDPTAALGALRAGWQVWQRLGAPYEAARVRLLIATACRTLGDEDAWTLEAGAARRAFEELGAAPDVARADALLGAGRPPGDHGLSARELQVLRLVAAGARNKEIATELVLSERTVERHVSNILAKLRLPSRAAATAYAYEHHLV